MGLVRHRQTKGPETGRPHLNHRVTPRLYSAAVNHKSKYLILSGCLAPRWPQSQIPQYPCPLNRIRVELGGSVIPVEKAGYFLTNKQSYRKLTKLINKV